jgi:hypothetical protein
VIDGARHDQSLRTWPLLAWLLVQLAALLLAVARVPLAAEYPRAAERLAIYLLLATQILAAAALVPWLLRGWRASILAAACCWPLLAITATLSNVEPSRVLAAGGYLTAWIATLALWNAAASSQRLAFVVNAVASAIAAGGPLLWYLRAEFIPRDTSTAGPAWYYGPVLSAFSLVDGAAHAQSGWPVLFAAIALGGSLVWIRKWRITPAAATAR